MPRLIWTPSALRDIARLHRFLATKNRDAARRAVRAIHSGLRPLTMHPEIGRPADELPPEFREWPIPFGDSVYIALYRYDGQTIVVLAVRHGREAGY
ncbi:MAG: type II toxin-antitoxin system RelE/ParE family toxin [Proteobacteria bacterium]|nr:type II toxin-antitoxin system RelE/ParE family toxin [Pseudomonadota bacterium]